LGILIFIDILEGISIYQVDKSDFCGNCVGVWAFFLAAAARKQKHAAAAVENACTPLG
jgi:hypothetical protein